MNFFNCKTTWSNAELIVVKIALLSAGMLVGIYGADILLHLAGYLWVLAIVTCLAGFYLWLIKIKR